MATYELTLPKMGESIVEATIISWSKRPGDAVEADETVLEVATDKVDSEVPSPVAGVIKELKFQENDVVPVGAVIALLETEEESASEAPQEDPPQAAAAPTSQPVPEPERVPEAAVASTGSNATLTSAQLVEPQAGRFYSPLVLNIARTEGIGMDELERVPGTGQEGRVTKRDIIQYVKNRSAIPARNGHAQASNGHADVAVAEPTPPVESQQPAQPETQPVPSSLPLSPATQPQPAQVSPGRITFSPSASGGIQGVPIKSFSFQGAFEVQKLDRMRKVIADNMAYSMQVAPHVSSFVESDVTNLVNWRNRHKKAFQDRYGVKLTFTPLFLEALVRCIQEFPLINASLNNDELIVKKDINIGVGVALPSGNLIVPVIRQADRLNLVGLAKAADDLIQRARVNKLKPDDLADGTYTLSNVGTFGNIAGTPIILQPQIAIMATGAIQKKPAVVEGPAGDAIAIRHQMILSHSYDHRVVDGKLGGDFVFRFGQLLQNWDTDRSI